MFANNPKPSKKQVAAVKAKQKREIKAAMAALNNGDGAGFTAHSKEAAVCDSWLRVYTA